jgi:hypothetical protein
VADACVRDAYEDLLGAELPQCALLDARHAILGAVDGELFSHEAVTSHFVFLCFVLVVYGGRMKKGLSYDVDECLGMRQGAVFIALYPRI